MSLRAYARAICWSCGSTIARCCNDPGFAERGSPQARMTGGPTGHRPRRVADYQRTGRVRRQSIRTEQSGGSAVVRDRIFLQSELPHPTAAKLRVTAYGPDNRAAASNSEAITLGPGTADVVVSLTLLVLNCGASIIRTSIGWSSSSRSAMASHSMSTPIRLVCAGSKSGSSSVDHGERVRLTALPGMRTLPGRARRDPGDDATRLR